MMLNYLAQRYVKRVDYDDGGAIAASGEVIDSVLVKLNALDFYSKLPPKSLGREWFEDNIVSILDLKVCYPS